ncbi:MAG: metallophosphoesterase [Phenylobacterium sp.]|nr:metallophosphoesterase [Phenylobacterium sp.]
MARRRGRSKMGPAVAVLALALAGQVAAGELSAMVVMGPDGAAQARVITEARACPSITIDGKVRPMRLRVAAGGAPQRPTASDPKLSKASDFPVTACEARLPKGARRVVVAGRTLPAPKAVVRRIVVIGDTGCRMKAADHAYQACNDPAAYPFHRVALRAAAWKPDLVLHVGDYEYRENPCEAGAANCAGSPWGYGWDAWQADFFSPGAPLLAAAPWVLVRGNHEDCARAGQGWMRFLDPRPLRAETDCNEPARDLAGDDRAPYAIPLGAGAQVVVADLTTAGTKPTPAGDPRHAPFAADAAAVERLSHRAGFTFLALHKPILGFAAEMKAGQAVLEPVTGGIQSVFAEANPAILPKGVDVILSGHIHLWQQVSFASDHPSQFIAGFSGTQEDIVPLPANLPADASPAAGARVEAFSSWIAGFGFMTLERRRADRWTVKVWDVDGRLMNRCEIEGRHSHCEKGQVG